jgi:iron(III) transport system substrate-binding protein
MMVLAAGCSTASNQAASGASGKSTTADKELVFYSAEGFDQDIATAFEKKTGIKASI